MYPNTKAILSLMAVLPVTSCESERSFNLLKLLKTGIRNHMTDERLNVLILMKVHHSIAKHLDGDDINNRFSRLHPRRMELENIFYEQYLNVMCFK